MRRGKVLSPIEAAFLGRVAEKLQPHDPGARTALAKAVGLSRSSVTAISKGEQVPHIQKWPAIGKHFGFRVDDLFVIPVRESPTLTGPVSHSASNDTSNPPPGDVLNAEAGSLRVRNEHLEKENAALRIALRAHEEKTRELATKLTDLARTARGYVRSAPSGKS